MISVVNIEVSDPLRHTVYWRESHTSYYDPSHLVAAVSGQSSLKQRANHPGTYEHKQYHQERQRIQDSVFTQHEHGTSRNPGATARHKQWRQLGAHDRNAAGGQEGHAGKRGSTHADGHRAVGADLGTTPSGGIRGSQATEALRDGRRGGLLDHI